MKALPTNTVKAATKLCLITLGSLLISAPATAVSVGDLAPDFEVTTEDGDVVRLSDFRGRKPAYVIFWNTWCSYCVKKTARYQKLQEQIGDKIQIIAINTSWDDTPEEMKAFEKRHRISFVTAFDVGERITDTYDVYNVPTEFIIDIDGIIRYRDGVPEYLAAHLPDWRLPYVPSRKTAVSVCTP